MKAITILIMTTLCLACGNQTDTKQSKSDVAGSKPAPAHLTPMVVTGNNFKSITIACPNGYKDSVVLATDSILIADPEVGGYVITVTPDAGAVSPTSTIGIRIDGTDEATFTLDAKHRSAEYFLHPYMFTLIYNSGEVSTSK